ncbi:uncharacterized protein LOC108745219 isoform X2 [Agrilus planipennis]|uniref:Uncharacterized protein LOC108745219 isoform X2 n=1 Tax=Agrilus planipennis TaxID=224129 RepID=A0A1W4XVP4_AGRPL|nr:uncharacterized protein LOC108745219 isoform X2 [Agrilus planipennis]
MGQKQSGLGKKLSGIKLPIIWVLRNQRITQNPNPQEPIKFQYKTRKKPINLTCRNDVDKKTVITDERNNMSVKTLGKHNCRLKESKLNNKHVADVKIPNTCRPPARTRSEPSLYPERREKRLYKIKKSKPLNSDLFHFRKEFGYEIEDVDDFLANATIEKPANIPVVLAFQSILYHTRAGGFQAEIQLPLGMVVNAVFKNENWLYVQTPHAVEGYNST